MADPGSVPSSFEDYIRNPRCLKCGSSDYYKVTQETLGRQRLLWTYYCHNCGSDWAVEYQPMVISGHGRFDVAFKAAKESTCE